ncbi:hypothetical protein M407DRAFT_22871 [Tulasnella calospora MUT 4182]|uniref:Uncharacterized protein n=1 Tax=Tulasnella calospora MUT 4182 TaxID=1051891 RepID=A0A0C3QBQ2_9AGAM|nr:hypothetical protein M407DRAFT_22871 [Tulasnella calospora MUT 4182]
MSSPPLVERFKGTNWEECHEFILAIRTRAMWEGKRRDSAWMADFAANYFWHKALSWHCRLPEDVREDWSKLEIALTDRWPEPEDDDKPQINPTPAAAPSSNRNDGAERPLQGLLKVVLDESNTTYYVHLKGAFGGLTTDASEAIRVRCNFASGATLLERTVNQSHSWLAAHWTIPSPKIEKASDDYAFLSSVDTVSLKSSWTSGTPFQLISCTVLDNGEVVPVWKKDDASSMFITTLGSPYASTEELTFGSRNQAFCDDYH